MFVLLHFWSFGTAGCNTFIRERSSAQLGTKRRGGCCIWHCLSWTDSIKPSLLFSNFECCFSEGSLFQIILNVSISNGIVSTKIYDKWDDFNFDIVKFPFLDGDVPRRTSYGVYIYQLIRLARASSNISDFNYRSKALAAKLLRQGYRYLKIRKAFSTFYCWHSGLVEKWNVSLKKILQHLILNQNSVMTYRNRKAVGKSNFSERLRKLINRYKRIVYNSDIMRQTACLVANPMTVDSYASPFNCMAAFRASDSVTASISFRQ